MFSYCISLTNLPDISKWNTSKITNMNFLFFNCISLSSIPNISKWNISKNNYLKRMSYGCINSVKIIKNE